MHPVTSAVLEKCIKNIFIPPQYGKEQHHITTLYLSRLIQSSLGWEAWQSDMCFSFLFLYVSRYALPMCSHSLVLYSWNWTRQRYRTMGGKTKIWDQRLPETPQSLAIIHLNCIAWGAHLIGVYGSSFIPEELHFSHSLDLFRAYFMNCFANHHTHKFLAN